MSSVSRSAASATTDETLVCAFRHCGVAVTTSATTGRPPKYCSDACRRNEFNARQRERAAEEHRQAAIRRRAAEAAARWEAAQGFVAACCAHPALVAERLAAWVDRAPREGCSIFVREATLTELQAVATTERVWMWWSIGN